MAELETVKKLKKTVFKGKADKQSVEFSYFAPEAKKVSLAGDFNAWDVKSHPMKKGFDGIWRIIVQLSPGKHEYKYFVDDQWVQELPCHDMVPNSFGTNNCMIGVD